MTTADLTAGTSLSTALVDASRYPATGVVYLLHFDHRYQHAGHYTGWTVNLLARLDKHAAGRGARLLAVVQAAGIGWTLARTWEGTRQRERSLKRQGGASRHCPICRANTAAGGAS